MGWLLLIFGVTISTVPFLLGWIIDDAHIAPYFWLRAEFSPESSSLVSLRKPGGGFLLGKYVFTHGNSGVLTEFEVLSVTGSGLHVRGNEATFVGVSDLDGDGIDEVIFSTGSQHGTPSSVWKQTGDGWREVPILSLPGASWRLSVANALRYGPLALLLGGGVGLAGGCLLGGKRSAPSSANPVDRPPRDSPLTREELSRLVRWSPVARVAEFIEREKPSKIELHLMLNLALSRGNKRLVELLLAQGIDLEYCAEGSLTTLAYAVEEMDLGMIHLLLDNGALINGHDKLGCTALHVAVEIEAESAHNDTDIWRKPRAPKAELTTFFLAAGADCKALNNKGESPLDWAMERKHAAAVLAMKKHLARKI